MKVQEGEYHLPKFRKGTMVEIISTGVKAEVERIHLEPGYGNLYKLKGIIGFYGEKELRSINNL